MKTEKLVKTIKCDQCPKEVSDNGEKSFGKSYFYGWIHLSINNGSAYIGDLDKKTEFDFCSMECLNSFSSKIEQPDKNKFPLARERTENSYQCRNLIRDIILKDIEENGRLKKVCDQTFEPKPRTWKEHFVGMKKRDIDGIFEPGDIECITNI